jgi:hypothetical protein
VVRGEVTESITEIVHKGAIGALQDLRDYVATLQQSLCTKNSRNLKS